jgi:hypothetical protein
MADKLLNMSFEQSDVRVAAWMYKKGPTLLVLLREKLEIQMIQLQAYIQGQKLSGQVLHQRTGRLKGSVREIPPIIDGARLIGAVEAGSDLLFYGKVHEYGSKGPYAIVPTTKKALRFMLGGKEVFFRRVMHPALPERSFMRSSLEELTPQIREAMRQGLQEALNA